MRTLNALHMIVDISFDFRAAIDQLDHFRHYYFFSSHIQTYLNLIRALALIFFHFQFFSFVSVTPSLFLVHRVQKVNFYFVTSEPNRPIHSNQFLHAPESTSIYICNRMQ